VNFTGLGRTDGRSPDAGSGLAVFHKLTLCYGLRETLPARRGILGDAIKIEGSLGPDILSPIYQSTASNDPVAGEMARLRMAPSKPPRKVMGVELTPQEYDAYQQSVGFMARSLLSRVLSTPEYARLRDEDKKEVIDEILTKSRDAGRGRTFQQFPDLVQRVKAAWEKKNDASRYRLDGRTG
jgi:hypothetical protein